MQVGDVAAHQVQLPTGSIKALSEVHQRPMGSTGKCCFRGWWQLVLIKKGLSQLYIETSVKNRLADAKRGGGVWRTGE